MDCGACGRYACITPGGAMAVNTGRVVTLPGGRASTRRRPQSDWQVFNPTDGFMPGRAACPARPANDCAGGGWRGCC
jgi:hypothetical protein